MCTGSVLGSTVGRQDNEDTGKCHTSCGAAMGSCVVSPVAEDQCEVDWGQEAEVRTMGSKLAPEDRNGQRNNWDSQGSGSN